LLKSTYNYAKLFLKTHNKMTSVITVPLLYEVTVTEYVEESV